MKNIKKALVVLLAMALCTAVLLLPSHAVENNGVDVSLTAQADGTDINAVLTVVNNGTSSIADITMELTPPDDYTADLSTKRIGTLAIGESVSLSASLTPSGSPQTDDHTTLTPAIVLVLAVGAVTALLVFGGKYRKGLLCLLLCGSMLCGICVPARAADSSELETVRISTAVNGATISATVTYQIADDNDGDGIEDRMEELLGTDPASTDTDGDGLSDYIEVYKTSTDPLLDNDDGNRDSDGNGLSNLDELAQGTDLGETDTDDDGIFDGDENRTYGTDPLNADTDGDGVTDGQELELNADPLTAQSSFDVTQSVGNASVDIALAGDQVGSLTVNPVTSTLFPEDMPGYLGQAYDFTVDGTFETADISFEFDKSALSETAEPVIYYFNEVKQTLEPLKTTVSGNVATATVEHFSTYILLDRTVYDGSFTWHDTWDSTGTYSSVEVVLVIDDSGSMGYAGSNTDPDNQRLTVAQELIDNLPNGCKVGVVWFAASTKILTAELTTDKETAKSYLTDEYFTSIGSHTYLYAAVNDAFSLFQSTDEDALKTAIVLTDGLAFDYEALHDSTIASAQQNNVRLYTVGLGDESICADDYLVPLAEETGGAFYFAQDAGQLAAIYEEISKMIDLSADTDGDSIPDYYEDNLVAFSGIDLNLDKTLADTDGDGLSDSEEVKIELVYSEDHSQVYVKGTMLSSPTLVDTDYDGQTDDADAAPYDNTFSGFLTSGYATSSISGKMDYSWFFGDNTVYNAELSKLSILFSSVIYDGSSLALTDTAGTAVDSDSISDVMNYFGFGSTQRVYLGDIYSDIHLSEAGIGHRNVKVGNALKTVVAVTIRGTNGTIEEWSSNCDIGELATDTADDDWINPLNHKGFDISAARIMRLMDTYIEETGLDSENVVYWVTGHSRGAAIANIIGANLEKAGKTAFTYTFAAPNNTLSSDRASYQTIFNIINEDDFVPCLPIECWGYGLYAHCTTSASILSSHKSEWKSLTGLSYNADENNMQACVDALGKIITTGADPRVDAYRYTCACHGDGSNDTITINNMGTSESSREDAIAKIPANALPYCIITRYEGSLFWGWDFHVCQPPAYLMQLLAAFMGGEISIYRFVVELNIADRYENAKTAIEAVGLSGIEHPHYMESYYLLACHVTASDFT